MPPKPPPPGSQWNYSASDDEMTGKASHAASVESENTVQFSFPYNGAQRGTLTLRRHPRFGNNVIFSIQKGQLLCSSYDGCSVLVRFDEQEPTPYSASPPSDNSTETLFIRNYEGFVAKLSTASRVRISPKVYQEGNVVFAFDVSNFDAKKYRGQ